MCIRDRRIRAADDALYRAKNSGRRQYQFANRRHSTIYNGPERRKPLQNHIENQDPNSEMIAFDDSPPLEPETSHLIPSIKKIKTKESLSSIKKSSTDVKQKKTAKKITNQKKFIKNRTVKS